MKCPVCTAVHPTEPSLDEAQELITLTAGAWSTCLRRFSPLDGFLVVACDELGCRPLFAEGACAPLAGQGDAVAAAFPDENEVWQGTAAELEARIGQPVGIPPGHHLVVHPLYATGRIAGLLAAAVPRPVGRDVLDAWNVTFISAATVLALFREHGAQRAQAEALRALDTISHALSRETDLQSLYGVIHREVSQVMECDAFYVCLYDGQETLDYVYLCDQGSFAPTRYEPLGNGPSSYCIRHREPFVLRSENQGIHNAGTYLGEQRCSESAIHVPMLVDGEPIGVLSAQSYHPNVYTPAHVQLLAIIAAKAAVAVRNAQLLERVRQQVQSLQQLTRALQMRDLTLERIDDFVVFTDVNGRVTAYNEAVSRALGYGPTELIGRPTVALRTSARGSWPAFQRARNRHITVTAKDGHAVPILYSTDPVIENGEVIGYLTIAKDLSELKRSEEAGKAALALERQRISRDLHDGLIQSLSIAKMQLQLLQRLHPESGLMRELGDLQETISRGLTEARHYIVDLKHAQLGSEGLVRATRQYAQELGRVTGLAVGVSADTESSPLSDMEEVQVFYLIREALNNVRKHARAQRVRVEFRILANAFRISVEDDGQGFDPDRMLDPQGDGHWGLHHIRERARDMGGEAVISSVPGRGTRVSVSLPLDAAGRRPSGDGIEEASGRGDEDAGTGEEELPS